MSSVIERILRVRDEASPALRGVATEARTAASGLDSVSTASMGLDERARKLAQGLGAGGMVGDLEDLAAAFKGVEVSTLAAGAGFTAGAVAAGGLASALYALGQAGTESLRSLEELGRLEVVTSEQIASVREIDRAMRELGVQWDRMIVALTDRMEPAISAVVSALSGWVQLAGYAAGAPVGPAPAPSGLASLGGAGLLRSTTDASRMQMTADDWAGLSTPTRSTGGRAAAAPAFAPTMGGVGNASLAGAGRAAAQSAQLAAVEAQQASRAAGDAILGLAQAAQYAGIAAAEAATQQARLGLAQMAAAQSAARAARIAGGLETGTAALTGGVEGVASVVGAAGPEGQAIAAAMRAMEAVRSDPQSIATTVRAVQTLLPDFLAALPEAIGAAVPAIIEGFVLGFPRIVSGLVMLIPRLAASLAQSLVGLPKLIADGLREWWRSIVAEIRSWFRVGGGRNRDERPERERGRGPSSMPGRQDRDDARRQRVTLGARGLGLSLTPGV